MPRFIRARRMASSKYARGSTPHSFAVSANARRIHATLEALVAGIAPLAAARG